MSSSISGRELFVHLAYLDDSDTKQKVTKLQVMSGVIMEDSAFKLIEIGMKSIRDNLVPPEKLDDFKEFHACELYGGYGVFEGIDQDRRFEAIRRLLYLLKHANMSVVYGAVELDKIKTQVYGSADPLDVSFRICLAEISEWAKQRTFAGVDENDEDEMVKRWLQQLVILIVDDCQDKQSQGGRQRDRLQTSFRSFRHPLPSASKTGTPTSRLAHFHDDMFFGDSRYSLGIQLADLCSYFIARYLHGDDEIRPFYDSIEPHIAYCQRYPDETEFRKPTLNLGFNALRNLKMIGNTSNEQQRIQEVRSDDAAVNEGSARGNQEATGQRESGEAGEETTAKD